MSFCPMCGNEVEAGAKFCGECGHKLSEINFPVENDDMKKTEHMPLETEDLAEAVSGEADMTEDGSPWGSEMSEEEMLWEQEIEEEIKTRFDETTDETVPLRPSQRRRAQQQQSGSTITIKKPNIDVKGYANQVKKLTKTQIMVIAEAVCLVVVIAIFCAIGSSKSSAESVAREYIEAMSRCDWSTVYDLTDYPDGKYLQKDQFIAAMESAETDSISNYEITENKSMNSGIQKSFYVNYTMQGTGSNSMELNLVKQADKNMMFFDAWKVSSQNMVVSDYCIAVPVGAEITIDGIAVSEDEKIDYQGNGMDEYYISLFSGTHTIQAALPWCQVYESEFTAYEGSGTYITELNLTEDGEIAMMAMMQDALKRFYESAINKEDFSAVADLFMSGYEESAKENYENFMSDLNDSENYILNEVTFSNFECDYYVNDSGFYVDMNCDYNMEYIYKWTSYWNNETNTELNTGKGTVYVGGTFAYDGETYKLIQLNVGSVL